MDKQFEELKSILTDELTIHNELVKTAKEMSNAIKEKNVDLVQMLTGKYDNFIWQVELLEVRRLELCDRITKTVKPQNHHMNLQNLIFIMPKEERKPFTELRASLKGKIDELVRINISNRLLLNESLKAINKNFELFSQIQMKFNGYKKSGTMDKKTVKKNIVNQIA